MQHACTVSRLDEYRLVFDKENFQAASAYAPRVAPAGTGNTHTQSRKRGGMGNKGVRGKAQFCGQIQIRVEEEAGW